MLDHSLRQLIGHSRDAEFFRALLRFVVKPIDVVGVIGVDDLSFSMFFPGHDLRPFDAMLGLPWYRGQGAEWYSRSRRGQIELAFNTGADRG